MLYAAGGDDWDAAIAQHINDKHLKPAVMLIHTYSYAE